MGVLKCAELLLLVVAAASMFGIGMANWNYTAAANWNYSTAAANWNHTAAVPNCNYTAPANWNRTANDYWFLGHRHKQPSSRFVVGGSENWRFGYNYTDWAIKNAPFYLNDALVFKYDPPNDTTFPHSVYLLPDFWSFQKCDLRRAKKIGEVNEGAGGGFEFVLKRWQPHYFACGEHDGLHCKAGLMKFAVWPLIRSYN
ncbi:UNVERIFIED_CONTAM: hypothetical protein Slati_3289100 [Sesamum latifolium]|uniref:Phytocyanin domain-containing protein n=1 Tax=Sesamum latifolium TaxID=2727402 RepID=A0AAW2V0K2_9LAMI